MIQLSILIIAIAMSYKIIISDKIEIISDDKKKQKKIIITKNPEDIADCKFKKDIYVEGADDKSINDQLKSKAAALDSTVVLLPQTTSYMSLESNKTKIKGKAYDCQK